MGGQFPDVRGLVPRTPPEGLTEWALEHYGEALARGGLVYEAAWQDDLGIASMLEGATRRRVKMVRVTCSCCGESTLLHWAHDRDHGYGFIMPEDVEGDWPATVTASGDDAHCPMCGELGLALKSSELRRPRVTASAMVMSAAVVGQDRLLALTGWEVRRVVGRTGASRLEIKPAEAYVFGPDRCAKLEGWRNGYSGQTGYFVQYESRWRQPEVWYEGWGRTEAIYGLTPELIAGSCLPHCKLDMFMDAPFGPAPRPVAYLRLYQAHPNVEGVVVHGLPLVLRELLAKRVNAPEWEKTRFGCPELPELDWERTRPAQMLRLTRDELDMARQRGWSLCLWNLFVVAKRCGQPLSEADIETAFRLGDERLDQLIPYGHLARDIRYLMRQVEAVGVEEEDEDPPACGIPDAQLLLDYRDMCRALGRNMSDPSVLWPRDLLEAHDRASERMKIREQGGFTQEFRLRRRQLRQYAFMADGLLIRPAASQRELTEEGDALHHCVATYGNRHATGQTAIFFIRRADRPRESWYTLELDERTLTVRQNRGMHNCARTPEVQAFEDRWLAWVRSGAPRDKNGRPVAPYRAERRNAS